MILSKTNKKLLMKYNITQFKKFEISSETDKFNNIPVNLTKVEWFVNLIKINTSSSIYFLSVIDLNNCCTLFGHFLSNKPSLDDIEKILFKLFSENGKPDYICLKGLTDEKNMNLNDISITLYPILYISEPYFKTIIIYTENLLNDFMIENIEQKTNLNSLIQEEKTDLFIVFN